MALQIKATKGNIVLLGAYLMIAECSVQKSMLKNPAPPEDDPDWVPHTIYTPETNHRAQVHIYPDPETRITSYGTPFISVNVGFVHVPGQDINTEAYEHVKANGIEGWTINETVDV